MIATACIINVLIILAPIELFSHFVLSRFRPDRSQAMFPFKMSAP
jgi:hypothetical protein